MNHELEEGKEFKREVIDGEYNNEELRFILSKYLEFTDLQKKIVVCKFWNSMMDGEICKKLKIGYGELNNEMSEIIKKLRNEYSMKFYCSQGRKSKMIEQWKKGNLKFGGFNY